MSIQFWCQFTNLLLLILSTKSAYLISTNFMQMLSILKTERTRRDLTRFILVARSPSEKKWKKKVLKDQKRKNRRSTPQFLVYIISELTHDNWSCDFTRYLSDQRKWKHWRNFSLKRHAYKKSKMKNSPTKMTSTHVPSVS